MKSDHPITEKQMKKQSNTTNTCPSSKKVMSVREMGDLLGIKKTDRYWLLHKNFFDSIVINGKTWVVIESFEKWYANQVTYTKVTGEKPGRELNKISYSVKDLSDMLGIHEDTVYGLVKQNHLETFKVNFRTRIRKDSFDKWYSSQSHYRKIEDLSNDSLIKDTITMPEMANLLGITRNQVYCILKQKAYSHFFETVVVADRKRITKESFMKFLDGQDQYHLVADSSQRISLPEKDCAEEKEIQPEGMPFSPLQEEVMIKKSYLALDEAASIAGVSVSNIRYWIQRGYLRENRVGNKSRINKEELLQWLNRKK